MAIIEKKTEFKFDTPPYLIFLIAMAIIIALVIVILKFGPAAFSWIQ